MLGRDLVADMPVVLKALAVVGTAAMIWMGGGINLHGLAGNGLGDLEQALDVDGLALRVGRRLSSVVACQADRH